MRKGYPSDISKEQFEEIREILENARKKTKPRRIDLYEVFCALLYIIKSGCQWRSVHAYFQIWAEKREGKETILEEVLKKIGR